MLKVLSQIPFPSLIEYVLFTFLHSQLFFMGSCFHVMANIVQTAQINIDLIMEREMEAKGWDVGL
jgi:hypothetical protein